MKLSAIEIIRNEHRSIAAVLDGLRYLTKELQTSRPRTDADFRAIRAMLHYLDVYPEQFHHPKEDRYLFATIRGATHEGDLALTSLQDDHERGEERMLHLMRAAIRAECEPAKFMSGFVAEVDRYVEDHWRHMNVEEQTILPLSKRVLTDTDWTRIDTAFQSNVDPLVGLQAGKEFEGLFSRVVNLAPAPIGLGSD